MPKFEYKDPNVVICYYHRSDFDGQCSAAIVDRYAESIDAAFIPVGCDYTDTGVVHTPCLSADDVVAVVVADFSFSKSDWDTISEAYGRDSLMWFDHHKTALDAAAGEWWNDLPGERRLGIGACYLVARYFLPVVPPAVKLMAQYDVWDKSDPKLWESTILPYHMGTLSGLGATYEDSTFDWDAAFNGVIHPYVRSGNDILKYTRNINRRNAKEAAYRTTFEGRRAIVCNAAGAGSSSLIDVFTDDFDMMIVFRLVKQQWVVGLYTAEDRGVDCSEIARSHGGGGHPCAAGFRLPGDVNPISYFPYEGCI